MLKPDAWSDGETAALTQYWNDGVTAGDIARRLCRSKNAVIGKAHRLALPPRPSPIIRGVIMKAPQRALPASARTLPALPGSQPERALWVRQGCVNLLTPAGVAALDRCIAAGLGCSETGRVMGRSRHVIKRVLAKMGATTVPAPRPPLLLAAPAIRTAVQAKQLIPPADELPDDPAPRPVLRLGPPLPECQWPTSQVNRRGAHLLCGAPVPTRRDVYCEACAKRAYQSRRPAPLLLEGAL